MVSRKKELTLQMVVNNQELWEEMLCSRGLIVVDVYQCWCGPCKTVVNLFRKIRNELGSDFLHFAAAEADSVDALEKYRGKCEPTFLFVAGGELVAVVRGANAPLLQKTILEQLEAERKIQDEAFLQEEENTALEEKEKEEEEEECKEDKAEKHKWRAVADGFSLPPHSPSSPRKADVEDCGTCVDKKPHSTGDCCEEEDSDQHGCPP